jgi:type IV pilus assembly protein PilA
MIPFRTIAVTSMLALAAAGCGGDDDSSKKSGAEKPPAEMTQQDDTAKTNARNLATEVETCFVDQQTYAGCEQPEGTQLPIGSGPGQVEVAEAGDLDHTIVAHSESGTNFTIAKDAEGTATRECDKPESGSCKPDGTW